MEECLVHDLIMQTKEIQDDLKSILLIDHNNSFKLIHEDQYINGITADFTLVSNNKIRAIVECKAGNIGITDYVRGIGQVMQYEYFYEEKITPKSIEYDTIFNSVLLFPSSVIKNNIFNVGRFKYPKSTVIVELNDSSKVLRRINDSELDKLKEATEQNLVTISQYYIRDNRLYELYILLNYLTFLKFKGVNEVNRNDSEELFLNHIGTQNNGNWRNAFISLSSLGFIDSYNIPTSSGVKYANLTFEKFAVEIYKSYIKPYFEVILQLFNTGEQVDISNQEICDRIKQRYLGRDVLFLTESEGRYISSWLNILRDDYGCLEFAPRKKERRMTYDLLNYNEEGLEAAIKSKSIAYEYINKYFTLLNNQKAYVYNF